MPRLAAGVSGATLRAVVQPHGESVAQAGGVSLHFGLSAPTGATLASRALVREIGSAGSAGRKP
ncbi:MAG: hypothetical protein HY744_19490 [Deltaproteobacteria bacterium]|nr:hypothetical protein [Deltaproteobacteria bacterium]